MPIFASSGSSTRRIKSAGGADGLSVPPLTSTREGPSANHSAGSTVCSTSVQLPALPIAKRYSPPRTMPGRKTRRCDPSSAPSTVARQISVAALTAVRCWRNSPGFARPARMLVMVNGWPVIIDRLSAERRICPPPSPCAPSSAIILFIIYPFTHTT